MEATPGFEPGIRALQAPALATWLCRPTEYGRLKTENGILLFSAFGFPFSDGGARGRT